MNRNYYFVVGMVILLLGLQFRAVESFTLNEKTSHFISTKLKKGITADPNSTPPTLAVSSPTVRTVQPPRWIGFALLSVGGVLVLHSFAMRKPG